MTDSILADFSGGLNERQPANVIGQNQLSAMLNADVLDGTIRGVRGTATAYSAALSGTPIGSMYEFGPGDLLLPHVGVKFVYANGFVYYVGNPGGPKKWDGTTSYPMGIAAPTVTPTVAAVGGGAITDTTVYYYTYFSSHGNAESAPSVASASITLTGQSTDVSVTASSNAAVTAIYLYRRITSTGFIHFVKSVANTTGTYNDNLAGVTAAANPTLQSGNYAPPSAFLTMIVGPYNNMLFAAGPDATNGCTVHWTANGTPTKADAWPPNYGYTYPSTVIALVHLGASGILVFTATSIHRLSGPNGDSITSVDVDLNNTTSSADSVVGTGSGAMWLAGNKLGHYQGGSITLFGDDRISDTTFAQFDEYGAKGAYFKGRYYLATSASPDFPASIALVFDNVKNTFSKANFGILGVGVTVYGWSANSYHLFLIWANTTDTTVTIMELNPPLPSLSGASANRLPYVATTREWTASNPNNLLHLRKIGVSYVGDLTIDVNVDGFDRFTKVMPFAAQRTTTSVFIPGLFGRRVSLSVAGTDELFNIGLINACEKGSR